MAESIREIVDIHSLEPGEAGWELCVYQTPQVLKVQDAQLAGLLTRALFDGVPVELEWDPDSGLVLDCSQGVGP